MIKAEVWVICRRLRQITQTEALIIPHILREPNSIIVLSFICIANLFLEEVICILNFGISSINHLYFAFCISSINWCDVIRSYKCFQYTNKLRHNVVYVFSIFYYDVITPNLGYYRTDMTISSTALNQSKLLNYFQ